MEPRAQTLRGHLALSPWQAQIDRQNRATRLNAGPSLSLGEVTAWFGFGGGLVSARAVNTAAQRVRTLELSTSQKQLGAQRVKVANGGVRRISDYE